MSNKTILIFGGSKGIGFATAKLFLKKDYKVIIASSNNENLLNAKTQLDDKVTTFHCDIAYNAEVEELFNSLKADSLKLDIIVNSAAMIQNQTIDKISTKDFDQLIKVNLNGAFYIIKNALHNMNPNSSIINISSLGGLQGYEKFPGFSSYCASKYGVTGLTETLAVELKDYKIRLNAIAPGAVNTEMLQKAAPHLKSNTNPEDIIHIIDFLSDYDKSSFINGSVIPINTNL